ncbi:hypothetical protein Lepto7375DRAFT_4783 [Leptolyngbya sp. PCC 7375]|nr:hypothetical protein Lepto7375DRAFT_4783 [Leptolyngbya sp. PCC 7375]
MAILDSKGRLFGKISLLDIGAGLIILMVAVAIFFYPGASGSVAQVGAVNQEVEVDVMTRGLTVLNPEQFLNDLKAEGTTNIIIRNQPYGQVTVKDVQALPRSTAVSQPDGSVKSFPDPRPELGFTADMLITLTGTAQITKDGPILGNSKVKIGTPIELEGKIYTFKASTVAVRILE